MVVPETLQVGGSARAHHAAAAGVAQTALICGLLRIVAAVLQQSSDLAARGSLLLLPAFDRATASAQRRRFPLKHKRGESAINPHLAHPSQLSLREHAAAPAARRRRRRLPLCHTPAVAPTQARQGMVGW